VSKTRTVNRRFTLIWRTLILGLIVLFGWLNFFRNPHYYIAGAVAVTILTASFLLTFTWNRKRK